MNQVVLITGASSGLGEALAACMAARGYRVYGTSRKGEPKHPAWRMLAMDVADAGSIGRAVAQVLEAEGRLDVLVNNAGVGLAAPLEETDMGLAAKAFDTNVLGMMRVCQAVLPAMRRQGRGRIVNISSIGSQFGLPFRGVYSASKAAADLLTESLRMEGKAFGIEACSVLAGDMRTPIAGNRLHAPLPEGSAYAQAFATVHRLMDEDVANGWPPERVADRVERLLRRKALPRKALVGKPLQRASVWAKRLLPAGWFERIILRYSGM
jgi:NAD(P)-dependent dehydrogenase (short-subunit alcohol dehydrogenase family)